MTTIMPESENLRKAVRWISEEIPEAAKNRDLVSEASIRFNLSPKETEYLRRFLSESGKEANGSP